MEIQFMALNRHKKMAELNCNPKKELKFGLIKGV
jgi:hypothetical protein